MRQDEPPRVTLIDFKSGDVDSDKHQKLDEKEMQLQVALYAFAAKKELEYQPEQGLVRYLAEEDPTKLQLAVPLDDIALSAAEQTVSRVAELRREFAAVSLPMDRFPKRTARDARFVTFSAFAE